MADILDSFGVGMPAPTPNGGILSALPAGFHEAGGILGAATQGVGQAFRNQTLTDWGKQVAASQAAAAAAAGNQEYDQHPLGGISNIAYTALKGLPQIGAGILGGLGGAAIGGALGTAVEPGAGTAVGGLAGGVGAAAAMFPFMYGQNVEAAKNAMGGDLSDTDNAKAAALAVPEAALAGWMPKNLSEIARKGASGKLGERVFKGAWTQAAVQGPASAVQTALTQQAFTPDMPLSERAREIVSSGLGGVVQGGLFGGVTHGLFKATDPNAIGKRELDEKTAADLKRAALSEPGSPDEGRPLQTGSPEYAETTTNATGVVDMPQGEYQRKPYDPQYPQAPLEPGVVPPPAPPEPRKEFARFNDTELPAMHDRLSQQLDDAYSSSPESVPETIGDGVRTKDAQDLLQRMKDEMAERDTRRAEGNPALAMYGMVDTPPPLVKGQFATPEAWQEATRNQPFTPAASMEQGFVDPASVMKHTTDVLTDVNPREATSLYDGKTRPTTDKNWVATGIGLSRDIPEMKDQGSTEPGHTPAPVSGEAYVPPGPPWHMTSEDSLTDLAQRLDNTKRVKVRSRSDDMAEGTLEAIDRINDGKSTKGDQLVAEHIGLADKDGNSIPLQDALATAHAQLDQAKTQHAVDLPHPEAKAGVEQAQARVDFLEKVQEASARRDAVHAAADAAVQAHADQMNSREAKLRGVEKPLKPAWDQLESLKQERPDFADQAQKLQTSIEKGNFNGGMVENGLRRVGYVLRKVSEIKAGEAAKVAADQARQEAFQRQAEANQQQHEADKDRMGNEGGPLPALTNVTPDMNVDQGVRQILSNEGSRGAHVLDYIAGNHPDGDMRALAAGLKMRGVDAPLKLDQTPPPAREKDIQFGEHVAGYDPKDGSVSIFNKAMLGAHTMLHELVHAGTAKAIEAGGRAARDMGKIYDRVVKHAGEEGSALYGLRDVHEFVAEAFANPRFREFLRNAKIEGPIGSLWRDFKNTVFRALGMDEHVRTALDEVLDTGHRLMDEQLKLTDGRSVPLDEAPHVGSVPDSNKMMMSFSSDTADQLKTIGTSILTKADRALRDSGWKGTSISEALRGSLMGWMDADGLMNLYKHHFGGAMEKFYGAKRDFDNLRERLAQAAEPASREWAKFQRDNPKTGAILSQILNESQLYGSDPRKEWANQSAELKSRKDAAVLAPMVDKHFRQWQTFVQNGGARVAEKMFSANRSDLYTRAVMLMHNLAIDPRYVKIGVHEEEHPGKQYLNRSDLHSSPELSEQYWKGKSNEYLSRAEAYLAKQDAEIARIPLNDDGSLSKMAQKMQDNLIDLREGAASIKTAAAMVEGRPYMNLGRSGDFFNAIQIKKTPNWGYAGAPDPRKGRPLEAAVNRAQELLDKEGIKGFVISTAADSNHIYIRSENADIAAALHEKVFMQLHNEGYSEKDKLPQKGNRRELRRELLREMAPGWVQKMADAMGDRAEARGLSKHEAEAMQNEIHSLWLDMVPDNSIHRVLEHREGVQGFNADVGRSFSQRIQTGINASAHLMTTPDMFDALNNMRERAEAMKSDPSTFNQAVQAHQVVNELATREARRPWSIKNTWIDNVLQANHSYFLGLSPGYATELMSQIGTLMWPELARKYGYLQSAQSIIKQFPKTMAIMKAVMAGGHLLDATIVHADLIKAGIDKNTADFVIHLANNGAFELGGFSRTIQGNANGVLEQSTKARLLRLSNALAINSETMPRILAALAARDLHESDPKNAAPRAPLAGGPDAQEAARKAAMHEYAEQTISRSMMNWASWTTPRHLGKMGIAGPLGPLVTKFMSFQIKMLERLHEETITAYGNHAKEVADSRTDLSAKQKDALEAQMRLESKRFLGAHMAAITSLSGTMGLPFLGVAAAAASTMANFLTNSDDYDLETAYRKHLTSTFGETAGSAIAHGLPRLANTDMSELGEDRLLPFSDFMTDKRKWEDASQSMAWRALGSPATMIGNVIRGGRDVYMGNSLNGMRELAPPFMKNAVDMYRMTNYGYVDKNGVKLPVGENRSGSSSVLDIMKAAVGLHSGELEDYDERARGLEGYRERRQFLSATIKVQLAKAIESGNAEDIQKWVQRASDFGNKHPLNNPLIQIAPYMQQRQIQTAQSRAFGTPIGTRVIDPGEMYYATK